MIFEATDTQDVLLINPEPALLRLTRAILDENGRIDTAQTLEQALAALGDHSYVAVLINFRALERRSWELLRALCSGDQRRRIVVLTTDTTPQTRTQVLGLGAGVLIYMPFSADALRQAVARAASRY